MGAGPSREPEPSARSMGERIPTLTETPHEAARLTDVIEGHQARHAERAAMVAYSS
jgi:hypothetical protein